MENKNSNDKNNNSNEDDIIVASAVPIPGESIESSNLPLAVAGTVVPLQQGGEGYLNSGIGVRASEEMIPLVATASTKTEAAEAVRESTIVANNYAKNGCSSTYPNHSTKDENTINNLKRGQQLGRMLAEKERMSVQSENRKVMGINYQLDREVQLANEVAVASNQILDRYNVFPSAATSVAVATSTVTATATSTTVASETSYYDSTEQNDKKSGNGKGYVMPDYDIKDYDTKDYQIHEYKSIYD